MVSPERARSQLVAELRRGSRVRSPAVAEAFAAVPRHLFLPGTPIAEAYADEAVATKFDDGVAISSASQPSMMAIMLEQLDLRPGHQVLEIGAGTGYNAALMARLVGPTGSVTAIDIDPELIAQAEQNLRAAGVRGVELLVGDGALGHPAGAPYDRIILTVGSWDVRPEWVAQLVPGGRLLLPLAVRGSQLSVGLDLGADGVLRSDSVRSCAFIRLRGLGAGPDATTPLTADGLAVQVAENAQADPDALCALLDDPGPTLPVDLWVGAADLWDGLGLWLAVSEPRVCRLLATGDAARSDFARRLVEVGPDRGTVALGAGSRPLGRFGLAVLVRDPPDVETGPDGLHPAGVQAFGPAGAELAAQLADLVDDWAAVGRPTAGELRLVVVPTGVAAPAAGWPGPTVVDKQHCRLLVSWWPSAA
ncbi:methyltransferase, FxLD system [Pseudonocardia acidicola]|uniref:Protein-L-isoaspartate O-methyltransferase n=1 Tax=Pseudonocardia acidicola TaxID=2724939 RepID=A0ABX1S8N1_9PSEU|nr:methyltransferase, FxLD system [Pseudonocardia acidicola]NMH96736.1 methyltransferase, FxLD system [Pseudonocardia acidicola]